MASRVLSTYRLQLRGDCFTFADAEAQLDYLDALGVSHLYLSPILTAGHGSTHGYDVTDPTTVSAELGGPQGLAQLSQAARARGMGLVVDIVPNHVGVERPEQNPWWWDVLKYGRDSAYSTYFDIDWELGDGRILLPVLGSDDDVADLVVDGDVLRLGDLVYPVAPGTDDGTGTEVHERQHYRLIGWRHGICGYRRFFSITSLAGLRQEDRAVFDATHVEVKRWFAEGLVDGVRVDHPDGLSDPAGYLSWLRDITGPDAWIVVEKILAADEPLEPTLPVAGTTGYDAMREIGGVFIDAGGQQALTDLFDSTGVPYSSMPDLARTLKARAVTETLGSELARLRRTIVAAAGTDHDDLPAAIAALLSRIGVYRSDYRSLSGVLPTAFAETAAAEPDLAAPLALIAAALAVRTEAEVRLQQLCGAATAKSMEDCLFYRDARLVSLNEVGSEPHHFGVGVAEFHQRAAVRARMWPGAMVGLTTHDTKRGEDVRARIGVLSQVPSLWAELVGKWTLAAPPPDAATGLFLWQSIFGVWPADGQLTDGLRQRVNAYAEKAIREAGAHTTWNDPDADFEARVHAWLDTVFDGQVAAEMTSLVARLDLHARSDALGQKLLGLTVPGIPDVYQGTELWEDSLVDPDNRRPVDYAVRRDALSANRHPKLRVVSAALKVRRDRPASFSGGGYTPILADGPGADHLVAFLRGTDVLTAVTRHTVRLSETGWADTSLALPAGTWTDRLSGISHSGRVLAAELFADLPVALLTR
ncbi:malto-oligosyltrehalose synthase [Mycolicibacterium holsaticum]|uniref:malto-oligosyltrehalose synthase n=1 Tax=Mycolicibacterium holsaticum TaxID=152142 RepID=UPI001C7C9F64|nr:malto-oligosyltrehalose synthase [Mycolicibacterium holsaticum]QZA10398.1 malto-oligosyltrehalose synthase [Mycolicibacterium holsaticum DSM 44478 = JCM 12374]UNC12097.1 malto-oligosyltrehalose synthase [Mycolicibacterium holsaticum DSM 44478 = JCM 12374]